VDPYWLGVAGLVLMVVLILLRMPISFALASIGTIGIIILYNFNMALTYIPYQLYSHISHFTFTAVPLFLFMGYIAFDSGLTNEAYDAARAWVGRLPGGLGLTTLGASALFAATSGSSLPECAAMSKIAIPEMLKSGYSVRLATGIVASAGGLAVVIPPSIIMIIYGVITETSVGELLIAGVLPGFLYVGVFGVGLGLWAYFRPDSAPRETTVDTSWSARFRALKDIWGIMVIFIVVMGTIYTGLVTPTEAAAIGAVSAILISMGKRKLTWANFKSAILETVKATAMIFLLLGGASIFTIFLSVSGVITSAAQYLIDLNLSPLALMTSLLLLYIIMGMFLDSISMMILTLPLVLPILEAQGFSLIWFGVIMCMIVEIGCITPPMGLNVYVMKGALGESVDLTDIFAGALPFVILEVIIVIILYLFPDISLWLPKFMAGS